MSFDIVILLLLSVALLLSVPRLNNKLPIEAQVFLNKKEYLYGVLIAVVLLSIYNIQYLVYFAVLYIMIHVCFMTNPKTKEDFTIDRDNIQEDFGIPTSDKQVDYYNTPQCVGLSRSTEDAQEAVRLYNNDFFSPK